MSWTSCSCRGPVEHHDRHVGDVDALRAGHGAQVLRDGALDVDDVGGLGPDGELLHVEHRGRVEHRPALGHGEHGEGVGHALGHERGAVDRVDRDVALGAVAVAHLLPVEEHRGLVLLALPDDDGAAHRHRPDELAHRVDGRAVPAVLVAAADVAAGGHGGGLGDPDELEREVAVGTLGGPDVERVPASSPGVHLQGRACCGSGVGGAGVRHPRRVRRSGRPSAAHHRSRGGGPQSSVGLAADADALAVVGLAGPARSGCRRGARRAGPVGSTPSGCGSSDSGQRSSWGGRARLGAGLRRLGARGGPRCTRARDGAAGGVGPSPAPARSPAARRPHPRGTASARSRAGRGWRRRAARRRSAAPGRSGRRCRAGSAAAGSRWTASATSSSRRRGRGRRAGRAASRARCTARTAARARPPPWTGGPPRGCAARPRRGARARRRSRRRRRGSPAGGRARRSAPSPARRTTRCRRGRARPRPPRAAPTRRR